MSAVNAEVKVSALTEKDSGNVSPSSEEANSLSKEVFSDDIQEPLRFTAEEERRVKLKTDLVILPLLCGVFFLQYLDKQSLRYASVFGLITDLDLKGAQYSWCSSIFYIGMSFSQLSHPAGALTIWRPARG